MEYCMYDPAVKIQKKKSKLKSKQISMKASEN